MSKRNKLQKFEEVLNFPNVYQGGPYGTDYITGKNEQKVELKGKWNENHFNNEQKITLELACGRGEYALALAESNPSRNFIGLDIKGARIWKGAKIAIENNWNNVAFLRCRIEQIASYFAKNEIDEIWITFPDPFLGKENRRLTSPQFIAAYRKILKPDGIVHLKTDSPELYEYSMLTLQADKNVTIIHHDDDIYAKNELYTPELIHKTYYEKMHLKNELTIKYIRFTI